LSAPPDLPRPVASFGATATHEGEVFIYGGHSGTRHKYNRDEVHGDLYRWTPGLTAWERLPADEPAQGASLLSLPGGVIRIGGMAARNAKEDKQELWSSETAALFLTQDKVWRALPKLPQRRSSHDSAVIGDTLYVIGGWNLSGGTRTGAGAEPVWHDTFLTLELSNPEAGWKSHPQNFKRRALAVQVIGDRLYAIGGMTDGDDPTTSVSILDTKTGAWSDGPPLPEEKLGGFGFAAIAQEGRLFASGVTGELLELRDSAWVSIAKLKHPRFFHRFVTAGKGGIIALGGESREGKKAPPEVITLPEKNAAPLSEDAPKTASTRPASPAPVWPQRVPEAESDWPGYQGPRGDSTTPEAGWKKDWPADGPPVAWRAELGSGLGSFAVVGTRVFAAGNDGNDQDTLHCLDLDTGRPVWQHRYAAKTKAHEMPIVPNGPAATPAVAAGHVYHLSREGDLLCLAAADGLMKWRKNLIADLGGKRPVYGYASSPFISEGRLYLDLGAEPGEKTSSACLDALTGEMIWQTGEGEAGYATPHIATHGRQKALVLFKGEALELREPRDGALIARHATQTRDFCNCATPVRHQDMIFISHTGNMGSRVLAWDDLALTEVWTQRGLGLLFQSGLPWQGHLLVFNDEKRGANDMRLIDLATGDARWQSAELDKGVGLLSDDGHAIILTSKGEITLLKLGADKPEILHRAQVLPGKGWVQPVLSHRRLLCKNNDGITVCLDLR
jgi:N-acetylneuraminic acid mutarotase